MSVTTTQDAVMRCEECTDTVTASLVLLATGGFGFRPKTKDSAEGWSVRINQTSTAWECRCPKHATQIEPAEQRIVLAKPNGAPS